MSNPSIPATRPNNHLAPKKEEKISFSQFINGKVGQSLLGNAISSPARKARFQTSLITLVAMNPGLAKCDMSTIISAALQAEALDLQLNNQMGFGYVLPYEDKKNKRVVAQFQVGWRGIIQLMIRSGQIKKIHVIEVKAGELIKYNPIVNDFEFSYLVNEEERIKAPVIGYYCFFETVGGYVQELYWTKEKMVNHAKTYSPGYRADLKNGTDFTFWSKDFDGMAKKTLLKQISKFAPMSVDSQLARALEYDQAVIEEDGTITYVDADNDGVVIDNPVEEAPKEEPKKEENPEGAGTPDGGDDLLGNFGK